MFPVMILVVLFVSAVRSSPCPGWTCNVFNSSSLCKGFNSIALSCVAPLCFRCLNGNISQVGECGSSCSGEPLIWTTLVLNSCGYLINSVMSITCSLAASNTTATTSVPSLSSGAIAGIIVGLAGEKREKCPCSFVRLHDEK
jgi:hypothetical protein